MDPISLVFNWLPQSNLLAYAIQICLAGWSAFRAYIFVGGILDMYCMVSVEIDTNDPRHMHIIEYLMDKRCRLDCSLLPNP